MPRLAFARKERVAAIQRGSCPRSAIAKGSRGPTSMITFKLPRVEITAPAVMMIPPIGPRKRLPASASGLLESASPGRVPIATSWTRK